MRLISAIPICPLPLRALASDLPGLLAPRVRGIVWPRMIARVQPSIAATTTFARGWSRAGSNTAGLARPITAEIIVDVTTQQ